MLKQLRFYCLLVLGLFTVCFFGKAQDWSGNTPGNIYYNQGNVGIGVSNPRAKFDVEGRFYLGSSEITNGWRSTYFLFSGHSLIIGTKPGQYAHTSLDLKPGGSSQGILYTTFRMFAAPSVDNQILKVKINTAGHSFFNGGNLGIGTETPDSKLSVNGNIRAHEIKLETSNWPDYVFEEGYKQMSLEEVEAFIAEHGHLPGLKSAEEYQEEGVDMIELNQKLLEKIEELTLQMIDLKKEVKELSCQGKKLLDLENRIVELSRLLKDE